MTETTTILEKAGIGGYEEYRIPAIAVTDRGTVLTAWESRKETGNDWAECHITVRRSTDDGKSFGEPQYIKERFLPGERITWNNPVLISDGTWCISFSARIMKKLGIASARMKARPSGSR